MDFTVKQYTQLLKSLQDAGFFFQTFEEYSISPNERALVLRHDVDARAQNSLRFARIQAERGIAGTYYFRMVPQSYDEAIIKEMVGLGHEIGYHYETMDTCRGNVDKAYDEFCRNLEQFRKLTPVKTISMHGSPLSKFDNRDIWQKYDYKKLGIIAEPYFDIDFNKFYYITDTGRRWDGDRFNVRDKPMDASTVRGKTLPLVGEPEGVRRPTKENPVTNPEFLKLKFHSTTDIIKAVQRRTPNTEQPTTNTEQIFPKRAMLNFHPQRWNDELIPWMKELVWQNAKNQIKRILIRKSR